MGTRPGKYLFGFPRRAARAGCDVRAVGVPDPGACGFPIWSSRWKPEHADFLPPRANKILRLPALSLS